MPSCANRLSTPRCSTKAATLPTRLPRCAPTLASCGRCARKTRLEAGFVAIDPASGACAPGWARATHARRLRPVQRSRRQPGSTFKPFVYGAALAAGMDPQREFDTRGVSLRLPDGTLWKPRDMGATPDGRSTLEDGLVFSRNSVTAQLIGEVGADKVATLAQRLGVRESPFEAVPSLALGTSPVSLLEMASAYASIAAQGEYRAPLLVTQVSDANGKPLMQLAPPPPGTPGERVMDPPVAVQLIELLRGAVNRGTGQGIRSAWASRPTWRARPAPRRTTPTAGSS